MPKAVIRVGYYDYVMEIEDAVTIAKVLSEAPRYNSKGWGETASHHIWSEPTKEVSISILSDDLIRIATMAGAPPKE